MAISSTKMLTFTSAMVSQTISLTGSSFLLVNRTNLKLLQIIFLYVLGEIVDLEETHEDHSTL